MIIRSFSLALAGALMMSGAALAQSNGRGGSGGGNGDGGGAGGLSDPGSHVGMLIISRAAVPGGPNRPPRAARGRTSGRDNECRLPEQRGVGFSDNGVALSICPTN